MSAGYYLAVCWRVYTAGGPGGIRKKKKFQRWKMKTNGDHPCDEPRNII